MKRIALTALVAASTALTGTGCIIVGVGWSGPSIWTEGTSERLSLDTADLSALEVRTHNGSITFEGQSDGADAFVIATKGGGGLTPAGAKAALEAIDVYIEPAGKGTQRLAWRWKGVKAPTWHGRVSFEIHAPRSIRLNATTHNGSINAQAVAGGVRVQTHNGPIRVEAEGGKLRAVTHNGSIQVDYAGNHVTLVTHNGRIVADLSRCGSLEGSATTHNGSVEVVVGEATSARLVCATHNGRLHVDAPIKSMKATRRSLTGTLGTGDGRLMVATHNGSVRIRQAG